MISTSTLRLAAAGLTAVLLLTGCASTGGIDAGSGSMPPATAETEAAFNDADTSFAEQMIAHHEAAIAMSDVLRGTRGADADVVELAERITAAQTAEIELMDSWLDDWGVDGEMGGMEGMDHGDSSMPGSDLTALESASGAEAGRLFLEQMIVHHRGAVEMAQRELDAGRNEGALALARAVIEDQTAEIAEMERLLDSP